jgi:hypothetical protein
VLVGPVSKFEMLARRWSDRQRLCFDKLIATNNAVRYNAAITYGKFVQITSQLAGPQSVPNMYTVADNPPTTTPSILTFVFRPNNNLISRGTPTAAACRCHHGMPTSTI